MNSSVRNEQIDGADSAADNMENIHPASLDAAGSEETGPTPIDPAVEADHEAAYIEESEHEDVLQPPVLPGLSEHETEDYQEFFKQLDDKHEIPVNVKPIEPGDKQPAAPGEIANYASFSKQELIALLKEMLDSRPIETIINEVENIKINYYKKHKAEIERKRKAFVEQGGELEDFQVEDDPFENEIKVRLVF